MSPGESDSETHRAARRAPASSRSGSVAGSKVLPRPELAGRRVVQPGSPHVYVIDPSGLLRLIPNHAAYSRLFRDWSGVLDLPDLENIVQSRPLGRDVLLVRGDARPDIYLLDHGLRRLLADGAATMDKYWFNWERVSSVRQRLVDHVPLGEPWE